MNIELTPAERIGVRRSWEIIRKDLAQNGMTLLIALFEKDPKKQALFKRFANVPVCNLKSSRAFVAQSTSLMSSFDDIVSTIERPSVMKEKMVQLGRYHKMIKARTKAQDFLDFNKVLLEMFPIVMAKEWNHDAEQGWIKVLSMIQMNVALGLDS